MNIILYSKAAIAACVLAMTSPSYAKVVEVEFRWTGDKPDEIDLGLGVDLPKMDYDETSKSYRAKVNVTEINPVYYSLIFRFGSEQYLIDLEMFEARPNISLGISHLVPHECRELRVTEASTPVENENIPQALSRYLLASQLIAIKDDGRCRDNQPTRLEKARLARTIQLGTFRGSPFRPTVKDKNKFAAVLGVPVATSYSKQIEANSVTNLEVAVKAVIKNADTAEEIANARELNDYLIADIKRDSQPYRDAGINTRVLEGNDAALERITS
jgi:hypothetical protein